MQVAIDRWSVWPSGLDEPTSRQAWLQGASLPESALVTDLSFIDALARRRLARLPRIALHVARQALADCATVPVVFSSQHGDLGRSLSILDDLARDEMPSPASFSLSVHNTTAGIFSIARDDRAPATAIAAGEETFLWALCEACLRTQSGSSVLFVYVDEPLPDCYRRYADYDPPAHAIALLLKPGNALELSWRERPAEATTSRPLSLAFLELLFDSGSHMQWFGQRLAVDGTWHGSAH